MLEYEKGSLGWLREKAKKNGFDNIDDWNKSKNADRKITVSVGFLKEEAKSHGFGDDTPGFTRWAQQNGILRNPTKVNREHNAKTAKNAGFDNINEYEKLRRQHRNDTKEINIEQDKKGSIGWLREKVKKNGFDNLNDWNKSKNTDIKISNSTISIGSLKEDAKKHGFGDDIPGYIGWAQQNGVLRNPTKTNRNRLKEWAKTKGFGSINEYCNKRAQKLGYKNNSERIKMRRWNQGKNEPMSENENCPSFLGVYIGENTVKEFLLTCFGYVKKMDYGNSGFDFICRDPKQDFIDKRCNLKLTTDKEYKIEVKFRSPQFTSNTCAWYFTDIDHSSVADIFILIALSNTEMLTPEHMWIFDKHDVVKGREFWDRRHFYIANRPKYLKEFKKYELVDELHTLKELCNNRIAGTS